MHIHFYCSETLGITASFNFLQFFLHHDLVAVLLARWETNAPMLLPQANIECDVITYIYLTMFLQNYLHVSS